jgi:cyclic di-GMP phosphodiesterase
LNPFEPEDPVRAGATTDGAAVSEPIRAELSFEVNTPESCGDLSRARILLVDDEELNLVILRRVLESEGFSTILATTHSSQAAALYLEFQPDLICLDLHMPELDGFGVLQQLGPLIPRGTYLPILMLTGDASSKSLHRALSLGARDFVTKPFTPLEVLLRIRNLLEPRFMHRELMQTNLRLEARVRERTLALDLVRLEVLERLARAAEFRDDATGHHTRRVGRIAALLAEATGAANTEVDLITRAAPLHDLGKIGIPDHILLKPGRLTPEEFEVMKGHSQIGAAILSGGESPLVTMSEAIARSHHERWDGTGYPEGLLADAIPFPARLVAIADVFDALTHDRPYRPAVPLKDVITDIGQQAGRHFDPEVAEAFLSLPHAELV